MARTAPRLVPEATFRHAAAQELVDLAAERLGQTW
jgi:hypothetical protein